MGAYGTGPLNKRPSRALILWALLPCLAPFQTHSEWALSGPFRNERALSGPSTFWALSGPVSNPKQKGPSTLWALSGPF